MRLKEPVEPQEPCGLCRVAISPLSHPLDVLAHDLAQHAAERLRTAQRSERLIRLARRQGVPDRSTLLDAQLRAQHRDGVACDQLQFDQMIEEAIDNTGAVHERR